MRRQGTLTIQVSLLKEILKEVAGKIASGSNDQDVDTVLSYK
jgi:hypothetical protein